MTFARYLLASLLLATGCSTVRLDHDPNELHDPAEPNGCDALRVEFDTPGSNSGLDVYGAASGPACGSTLVGSYFGAADVGGPLPSRATWTGWVARLDETGRVSWRRTLSADGDSATTGVLTDATGNTWITGTSDGPLFFDDLLVLQGTWEYVLALSPSGELLWAARLPGHPSHGALRDDGRISYFLQSDGALQEIVFDGASGVASTRELATGDVGLMAGATRGELTALVGCTASEFTIDGRVVEHHDDTPDGNGNPTCDLALFVVDRQGSLRWLRTFEEEGFSPYIAGAAINDEGDVALIASFWGTIDLGEGLLTASPIGEGMRLLLGTFSAAGQLGEAGAFGEAAFTYGFNVVTSQSGGFAVSGNVYDGSVDFVGTPIESGELSYMGFQVDLSADGEISASQPLVGLEAIYESGVGGPFLVSRRMSPDGLDLGVTIERAAE